MRRRISPDSNLCDDISTESERVRFLQAVAAITLTKTRTRLNLKKLYAADGAAVQELLKLAQLLHKATHTVSTFEEVRCAGICSVLQEAVRLCGLTQQHAGCAGRGRKACTALLLLLLAGSL